jgi:hypothetical protein
MPTPSQVATEFPNLERNVRLLVEEHKTLKDEPLVLAVYYAPERNPEDVFLFEVIEGFGGGSVDPERTLFEVTYGPSSGFPMEAGQRLHLILTNPEEFRTAARDGWSLLGELKGAVGKDRAKVVFSTEDGKGLSKLLGL